MHKAEGLQEGNEVNPGAGPATIIIGGYMGMAQCNYWEWQDCPLKEDDDDPCPIPEDKPCYILLDDEPDEPIV